MIIHHKGTYYVFVAFNNNTNIIWFICNICFYHTTSNAAAAAIFVVHLLLSVCMYGYIYMENMSYHDNKTYLQATIWHFRFYYHTYKRIYNRVERIAKTIHFCGSLLEVLVSDISNNEYTLL